MQAPKQRPGSVDGNTPPESNRDYQMRLWEGEKLEWEVERSALFTQAGWKWVERFLAALIVAALVACDASSPLDPIELPSIEGAWAGIDSDGHITEITIADNPIMGCVGFGEDTLRRPFDRVQVQFVGSLVDGQLQVRSRDGWAMGWTFYATFTGNQISGTSNTRNWGPTSLVLSRVEMLTGC